MVIILEISIIKFYKIITGNNQFIVSRSKGIGHLNHIIKISPLVVVVCKQRVGVGKAWVFEIYNQFSRKKLNGIEILSVYPRKGLPIFYAGNQLPVRKVDQFGLQTSLINPFGCSRKEVLSVACQFVYKNIGSVLSDKICAINFLLLKVENHNTKPTRQVCVITFEHKIINALRCS